MNHKVHVYKSKLDELKKSVTEEQNLELDFIRKWVAGCVSVFVLLGVNNDIIRGFLNMFEGSENRVSISDKWYEIFQEWRNPESVGKRIDGYFYVSVAFGAADDLVNKLEEEERLVPLSLIQSLDQTGKYDNLVTSLREMENKYSERDSGGLLLSSKTLLESIFNLDKSLLSKDSFGGKLVLLLSQKDPGQNGFGADRDLLYAINNIRSIRNHVEHKNLPLKYDMPFLVSLGSAYLAIIFLEITMSKGELIK